MALHDISRAEPGLRRWFHGFAMAPPLRWLGRRLRWPAAPERAGMLRWNGLPWLMGALAVALMDIGVALLHATALAARLAWRLAPRVLGRLWEGASAFVLDSIDSLRERDDPILRTEPGQDPAPDARAVAVMVQFSPDGTITDMVRRQIEAYRALGFAVVLVSNSPAFPEPAWQSARQVASLVVHRRNRGLDFGAWKDLVPVALARWPTAEELLLVNDSVLGPIRPVAPVVGAMREAGPGVFGLLESLQGGPHLQSWFTLARGPAAVADLARFLARLRLSRSKWIIIQRGELRLARAMRAAGHRVAAWHGYTELLRTALADPVERAYLERALPAWLADADAAQQQAILTERPLNPAHHLWRVLCGPAGCPFIKTELVRRNPGGLPDVECWPELVPPDSPCPLPVLRAHLAALGP
jgi:hypothetical protein